jgi:hypothetical protein
VTGTAPAPAINGISPASGPPGTRVTITGSGFTGATSVTLAGRAVGFSVSSDSQIVATIPNGGKSGTFRVTTPNGSATSSQTFTVTKH